MRWDLPLPLDRAPGKAVYLQLADGISREIASGRLRHGQRLPGSRQLAKQLKVHRNTVLAAIEELVAEGWLTTRPGGGTFVAERLPPAAAASAPGATARSQALGFDLAPLPFGPPAPTPAGAMSLGAGTPDVRQVPMTALAAAYRRVLKLRGRALLDHGDPRGHLRLRTALAEMISTTRGLPVTAEEVLVTRGSQMALFLAGRALVKPGDVVAVEELGYRAAWDAFRLSGAELVPLPLDAEGVQVDALARLAERRTIRAVYLTPHTQYPTTAVLTQARRAQLLELARRHRIAILEDDYDHDFHFEGPQRLPLARADEAGSVIYLGSLSKLLAPGLRLGFVVAPAPLLRLLADLRFRLDRQGDQVLECAIAEMIEDGELQRHALRMRRLYQSRRDVLVEELRLRLGGALAFEVPRSGVSIWCRVEPEIDLQGWSGGALRSGLIIHPAQHFAFDGQARPAMRLGFAALTSPEIREAIGRLAEALPGGGGGSAPRSRARRNR